MAKRYELIGGKLGQSFSKQIHEALGEYSYHLRELPSEAAVVDYLRERQFAGCNVTIPYKQTVMPHLDEIDPRAAAIGSVNTIVNRNGILTGYNTDYDGFMWMLQRKNVEVVGRNILLLGDGGTAKTARVVLQDMGAAKLWTASRRQKEGCISYEQAQQQKDIQIVVNTSPAGMYPDNGTSLVDVTSFPRLEAVVDVVYNPLKTKLLLDAEALAVQVVNGLPMLVRQAVVAGQLYTGKTFAEQESERILKQVYSDVASLVLIGMPSSGKTRLGQAVARKLQKKFVDTDRVLVKQQGREIPEIFAADGEAGFRAIETAVLAEETQRGGKVLSTGGGVVTQEVNLPLLRQNGVVIWIDRPLSELHIGGDRPLSHSEDAVREMYRVRRPLYKAAADIRVANNAPFMQVVHRIVEAYDEILSP